MNDEISNAVKILNECSAARPMTSAHAQLVFKIIDRYFGDFKRSRLFRGSEVSLSHRFREILDHFNHEQGVDFAKLYFLFCYTLALDYKHVQTNIYDNIALPYSHWVKENWGSLNSSVKKIQKGDEYVFLSRMAVTKGGYAPGASIFTFSKALLKKDRKVTIISLGPVSAEFNHLSAEYPNLKILGLENTSTLPKILSLIELLKYIRPRVVLTEIEFDVVSVLAILQPLVPVIFLSPGYYNLPWYDKIALTDNLSFEPIGNRTDDFFEIPTYVSDEILAPPVDETEVEKIRVTLGLTSDDFVIGSFARMEKFQVPFLNVLNDVLARCSKVKVILAGLNDSSAVQKSLQQAISMRRAFVLPNSDVHVLGHCLDLGIDTFPTHSGFSVLELMAKGIPVVSKRDTQMESLGIWRQRLPELLCMKDVDLVDLICELAINQKKCAALGSKSKKFTNSQDADNTFIEALDNAIQEASLSFG